MTRIPGAALAALLIAAPPLAAAGRPNVLFVVYDDLRPQLGCYGDATVKSPYIDRFAAGAVRFERAYCQSAICSPSRNSFLGGLRPSTTGLYGFGQTLRSAVPDVVTLPQQFKNHGYDARGVGKIFHFYAETGLMSEDDPASWSRPVVLPAKPVWGPALEARRLELVAEAKAKGQVFRQSHDWPRPAAWDDPDIGDDELQDGEIAAKAIDILREKKGSADPFFLAVGFLKPHLPFVAPKKYWDLYDPVKLVLPSEMLPAGAPPFALRQGIDRSFDNIPKRGPPDDALLRRYLHGYLASISYADAQVGRVLAALDELGLRESTAVVLFGDHGYQMGEHGNWGSKHSNYETSTRVPLLVSAPGMKGAGRASMALVELLDIYPTLADVCGLPAPERAEGKSFRPLLDDPAGPGKAAAFSEYKAGQRLGSAIRTERFRYVEWADPAGKVVARELYDHAADPGEQVSVAGEPAHAATVAELSAQLRGVLRPGP